MNKSSSASESKSSPARDQAQSSKRSHRTHGLEALWIKNEEVDAAAEHGHSGSEQNTSDLVLGRGRCKKEDARVHQLLPDPGPLEMKDGRTL